MLRRRTLAFTLLAVSLFAIFARAGDDASLLLGTWKWTWKDAEGAVHTHRLDVEGSGEKLAAREFYDEMEAIKVVDLKLTGKKVSFSVLRGNRQSSYTGTLQAKDRIEGLVNVSIEGQTSEYGWEATREEKPK